MALSASKIKFLLGQVAEYSDHLAYDHKLYMIFKGALLKYVVEEMYKQMSGQSAKIAEARIPPINVLQKIINKLSRIYATGVSRQIENSAGDLSADGDRAALAWYDEQMNPNAAMTIAAQFLNLTKRALIQPYLSTIDPTNPKPAIRVIPSHAFIAYSTSKREPEKATGFIMLKGTIDVQGKKTKLYYCIDADEFGYFTGDGDDVTAAYAPEGQENGANELGMIPLVYLNNDPQHVMPIQDSDTGQMATLVPLILADANFANMFQSFSIIYTVDVDDGSFRYAPNARWSFKTDPALDRKPQVGTLTPSADLNNTLNLVANQLAFWLQTKDVKPGAIGEISASNFSSGISKIVDEMDTSENRKDQIPVFQHAERQLWDIILKQLNPQWIKDPAFGFKATVSDTVKVNARFVEQIPLMRRGQLLKDLEAEVAAGFNTRKRAMMQYHPHLSSEEIDSLMAEIQELQVTNTAQSMNGAQVDSMVQVVERVASGILPVQSAIAILINSFGMTLEAAQSIIGPIVPGSTALVPSV